MKASTRDLFPNFYDARQTESGVQHVAVSIGCSSRGTYFVAEADGELVACGGWSCRDKLYAGVDAGAGDARLLDPERETRTRARHVRALGLDSPRPR
jgi:hypothetical protein